MKAACRLLVASTLFAATFSSWASAPAEAAAPEGFASSSIRAIWQRDDGPVASGSVRRPWLWGPGPFYTDYEPYREASEGSHLVQYFDKGRLEINNPQGNKNSQWFVTSGLLVKEMVNGAAQVGDQESYVLGPANEPVAGDAGVRGTPTYASFAHLTGRVADRTGQPVTDQISVSGTVSKLEYLLATAAAGHFEQASGHNWADLFWSFVNSPSRPAGFNWLTTLGYPITEPYWASVKVAGTPRIVLVQLFERRVLTYNPDNPAATRVEMGNVGRHYYLWRYKSAHTAEMSAQYNVRIVVGPAPRRVTQVDETLRFTNGTGGPLRDAVFRSVWQNWDGVFSLQSIEAEGKAVALGEGARWQNGIDLRVDFPSPVASGQQATVHLTFTVRPRSVSGRSGVDVNNDILCLGDMLPTLVPWQNGGWASYPYSDLGDHGYYLSSNYSVQIESTGGERLIVGGTGEITGVDQGRTSWTFEAANVRDVGYVVSPRFVDPTAQASMTRQEGRIKILAYFLPGHTVQAQRQLDLVQPALRWFGQTFGAYPFDTFVVAEMGVPQLRTDDYAQEYPMCYFIPTNWLGLGTTAGAWTWYTPVHETGHQWFYSTVGNNQLTAPWLDETLTSYATTEYTRMNFPDLYAKVWNSSTAGAGASKPVSSGVFSGFSNENEYSATVYDKGVAMLDKVRRTMGDTAFYAAMRDYYAKYRFKQAQPSDLLNTLQAHTGVGLGSIFAAYLGY